MIIALIKFIVILLILVAVVATGMYFTEPTSEFHAKVKIYIDLQLYQIKTWLDEKDDDAGESQGNTEGTELPEYDNAECNDKFGADFEYLSVANSVSYGGDSPETAYTNGFQAACKAAAQYRKQWNDAQTDESSTVSENSQVYVDLIQGICTNAEIERIATTYPETNNIDEYIRGVKDACKGMSGITL
jgi:hypothetical protein